MKENNIEIKSKKISDLIEAEYNPRKLSPEQEKTISDSIKRFGIVDPVLVNVHPDRENVIIGGHQRTKVAKKLGFKEVPCVELSLTLDQEKELNVRLNKNTGEFDFDALEEFFSEEDLIEWGFNAEELDFFEPEEEEEEEVEEDDFDEEPPEEPKTELGRIYQLGEHRLMCGDSTSEQNVKKLMGGEKADCGHNDPPYGMKKEAEGVKNDNLNYDDLLEFNKKWIPLQFNHLKENGSFYCWGIDEPLMDIYSEILKPSARRQELTFRNLITWNKGHGQGQNSENTRSFAIADEKCLFVMKGVQGFNNNADNYFDGWDSMLNYLKDQKDISGLKIKDFKRVAGHSESSGCHWFDKSQWMMPTAETYKRWQAHCERRGILAFKKEYEELKKEHDEIKKEYYSTRAYFDNTHDNMNNVWNFPRHQRDGSEGGHATPKPLELCARAIKSSTPPGGIVIDVFGGSGSTLIACDQTGRACRMMELDPKYCDVIVRRYCKLKGIDPEEVFETGVAK